MVEKQCPKCKGLTPVNHRVVMTEPDEDATEGQESEHEAMQLAGLGSDWDVDEYYGVCRHCGASFVIREI